MTFNPVTVIIPTLNACTYLEQALDSVCAGTVRPREILVVDGGSTDDTKRVATSFESVKWIDDATPGYGAALNRGIRDASGELVAFLEADDVWLPQKLELQLAHFLAHPACRVCFGGVRRFIEPGHAAPAGFRAETLSSDLRAPLLSAALMRRTVFDEVGLFDSSFRSGADMDWIARAKDLGVEFEYVPELIVRKRIHDHNVSSQIDLSHSDIMRALKDSIRRKRESPASVPPETST
jgi:glycosyltransferase involved in cell wall biosynthesis